MKTKLNIQIIPTYDLYSVGFADVSKYNCPEGIIGASIEITPPHLPKVSLPWEAKTVNIYRSTELGITQGDPLQELPDGVYTLKYSISPANKYFVEKKFFRFDKLKCQFQEKFLEIECNCASDLNHNYKKQLREIHLLFEGIIAASNNCDISKCNCLYSYIQNLLSQMETCNCPG